MRGNQNGVLILIIISTDIIPATDKICARTNKRNHGYTKINSDPCETVVARQFSAI